MPHKSVWKSIYSCDGLCSKHKFCHIFEPFFILYFLSWKPLIMRNESKIWVMSWWLINDENEKNKWIIKNKSWTSQIIVVRKCGKICVSNKLKMWQNLFFSRDQGFGEKKENRKWLKYVAKFVFPAYAITWINPLSNTFMWQNLYDPVTFRKAQHKQLIKN